jgi:hypothetical protein
MTTRTKKLLSILLLVCMIVSMIPVVASAATPSKLYLKPNSNWTKDNARFAAYFFGNGEKWVSAVAVEDGYYEVSVPSGYSKIIFCRMNPSTSTNNWNNRWNQTSDLTVPTDGTNCYTVKEGTWSAGGGSWSKISFGTDTTEPSTPATEPTTPSGSAGDYYLFGYINATSYGEGDDYATLGKYKFVNGKLTCTFPSDSYVGVKSGDNSHWYMTDGWYGAVTSATLYDTGMHTMSVCDKLMVPGGVELTFTLEVDTSKGTAKLSYVRNGDSGFQDETGIQNGVTLHAWNWSFNAIKDNMALIASQGYTAVQTAPIQPVKESTAGKDMHGVWWVQYQPIDFIINTDTNNPIGTASEFKAMCAEAEKYGIQVIVDVVANHMANHMSNNTISTAIPAYIRNDASAWHDYTVDTSDYNNRYDITQHCMAGIPDLNTGSKKVQGYVLNFLKECIDAGADGFRFDGAKHIETPDDDASFASDFWPTVIGGAEEYAASLGRKIYCYGELLDLPGGDKLPMLAYTKYMAATDNGWGNALRSNVSGGNAAYIKVGYNKPCMSNQLVVWAESHDTYATDDAGASSYKLSTSVINKTWALVAARANIMGLYFARPSNFYSTTMGTASLNTGWDFAEVKAVNKFHNAFVGQSEMVGNSNNIAVVVRGTTGIVLVNVSGNSATVKISGTGMANGTYKDQITGNTFTVSNGKISGKIGSTGIAVVYNPAADDHTHSYTSTVTAPTCENQGYTTYTCSCGNTYTGNVTSALGHSYSNGVCIRCGAQDPNAGTPDVPQGTGYYLFGYINGANYACEDDYANLGAYKFVNGKLTVTFEQTSYVGVKTADNGTWYMTKGWQGSVTSATLYDTSKLEETPDKLMVPGGVTLVFTLTKNSDGTLTLSYAKDSNEGELDELEFPTLTLKSFSLSFEDKILVNMYYTVSDMSSVVEQGMLVYYSKPSSVDIAQADDIYTGSVYDSIKGRYMNTTEGIAAKEMGDNRYYAAYAKLSNGTYAYSNAYEYSPKKYSMNMLGKTSTSDKQKALCVAMLNYGAAAQGYFKYNTDNLMNNELTAAQKALNISYDESLFTNAVAATAAKSKNFTKTTTGFSKRTATVSFEGAFVINYYFTPSAAVKGNMTFYYWTPEAYASVTTLTKNNASGTCAMVENNGVYFAEVTGIPAKALDQTYYVAGVYTDASGNTYCTGVIAYSLSKYCINNANGNMGELAKATAMYGYYAAQNFVQ